VSSVWTFQSCADPKKFKKLLEYMRDFVSRQRVDKKLSRRYVQEEPDV
jgi:hypothetical protein